MSDAFADSSPSAKGSKAVDPTISLAPGDDDAPDPVESDSPDPGGISVASEILTGDGDYSDVTGPIELTERPGVPVPPVPVPGPHLSPAPPVVAAPGGRRTYLIVDGENIDATLGMNVLGHRPIPEERPRWDRIVDFGHRLWGQEVTPLFFLNATSGQMPMPFVQALLAMGYRPIPLAGSGTEKVVDIGIQRTLEALDSRPGDVLLASHDGDFIPQVENLLTSDRRVGLLCFREFVNARFTELANRGLGFYDLEQDAKAFITILPRVRIIRLEEFDPVMYL